MSELKHAVALVFKRSGKSEMTQKELVLNVSMGLKWFSPDQAKEFVKAALDAKLMVKTKSGLKPAFDPKSVEIPFGFSPGPDILEAKEEPVFLQIVSAIVEVSGAERQTVISKINKKQERNGVDVRVAALLIAKESGVDVEPFLEPLEKVLRRDLEEKRWGPGAEEK